MELSEIYSTVFIIGGFIFLAIGVITLLFDIISCNR